MAGHGPAPSDQRVRRAEPARGDWIYLPPVEKPVLPTLPRRNRGDGWSARTRSTWANWRRDRATTQFGPADIASALDLAYIYEDAVRGAAQLWSEIRLRMDGLGLTPKGKQDRRWKIPPAGVDSLDPPPEDEPQGRRAQSDRRGRLTVVK